MNSIYYFGDASVYFVTVSFLDGKDSFLHLETILYNNGLIEIGEKTKIIKINWARRTFAVHRIC